MISRILSTPIPMPAGKIPAGKPRRIPPDVLASVLPGPGRDRLASGEVLVVTTGQQPGLFTGPLYTIYKALSAIALADRLERERAGSVPVVPVFWVAGDDHDFAEANHAWVLGRDGEPVKITLRERARDAPQLPLFREPLGGGGDLGAALAALDAALPDSECKPEVRQWLESSYRPEANFADAGADALNRLLAARGKGLAIFRAHDRAAKRAATPWLLRGLEETLPDGLSPVLVEGRLGRDRLRQEGGEFVTRRSGERFTRAQLEQIATDAPERLSPNVLLRPVIEAALFPTLAYVGGPGEMEYLPESAPLFARLGVTPQAHVPRWSGVIIEARVDKVLTKHGLTPADFNEQPGALESRLAKAELPPDLAASLEALRADVASRFARISGEVQQVDPTLERTVESARNAALAGTNEIEKKLVASLKRAQGTLVSQLTRARAALAPFGKPQERVLTVASFLARYSGSLLEEIEREVARWAATS
ncbi:MAG TPA: bacillithiol biosynthesis BshC [Gemmatimonadales bacterium]|nr:bacillithiol biosynthesis BshC [Gemmatimonadales bacterium]